MSQITRTLLSAVTFSFLLAASTQTLAAKHHEKAQESVPSEATKPQETTETTETINLGSFFCKDVMRLSGDERDMALSFMHGYYLGKKGVTEYVAGTLGKASDDFMEYCLDHPNDKALESMGKFLK